MCTGEVVGVELVYVMSSQLLLGHCLREKRISYPKGPDKPQVAHLREDLAVIPYILFPAVLDQLFICTVLHVSEAKVGTVGPLLLPYFLFCPCPHRLWQLGKRRSM